MSANHQELPWHAAFPEPKSAPRSISRLQVKSWLQSSAGPSTNDFLLVDVRRNDHEGGTIIGSINLPAQSLYYSIPSLFALCTRAGIKKVVWYCGSCGGRGPRAASWFADYVAEHSDESTELTSLILESGIKGWVRDGDEYTRLMDVYDAGVWQKQAM